MIKKYEITQIGEYHTNHCEDFLITSEIGDNKLLLAVMDGCTMGTESHFASTLIGKLLRKIGKDIYYKAFLEKKEKSLPKLLREIMEQLFEGLKVIKNQLGLDRDELLSTLIISVVNSKTKEAEVLTIGDGLVNCNGELFEYEQDNRPDYLGYHLSKSFVDWYELQEQRLSLSSIQDFSISTDGIFTFDKFDNKFYESIEESELIYLLLNDKTGAENEKMLHTKLLNIERTFGLRSTDDLGVVRLILE